MFGLNLSTYALMACVAGWGATSLYNSISHKIELSRAVTDARATEKATGIQVCNKKLADVERQQNDYANGAVAAGSEAAAGVPQVTAEGRKLLCGKSSFCRGDEKQGE